MAADTRRWAPFSWFYPISLALVVAMVLIALRPGLERQQAWREQLAKITTTGLVVEGRQLGGLVVNDRASVGLAGPGEEPYVIVGSSGTVTDQDNNGARYWLPADAVKALRGREVEIALEVRSAPVQGSQQWLVRLAIAGVLDTGWQPQEAESGWRTVRLRVPIPPNDRFAPLEVIFWSDATGDGGRIELRRIAFNPVGAT